MYYDTRHQSTENKDYATYPSSFQTTLPLHTPATTSAIIVVDGTTQKLTWYVTSRVSTLDKKLSNVNVVTLNSLRAGTSGDIMTQFILNWDPLNANFANRRLAWVQIGLGMNGQDILSNINR